MKIIIVGTAYPLRGGIAHHISLLQRTLLRRGHEVKVITFKRQYPKFLFPGKSQEEITTGTLHETNEGAAEQIIDSINPITWMKAGTAAAKFQPDLIIFKYWIPFFAPAYGVLARTAKRLTRKHGRECKIAFIVDNVLPHEKRPGDLMFTKFAFRSVDYFIVLSDAVERELTVVHPTAKIARIDHPVFENFGPRVDRSEARKQLGIPEDAPAILFFGYIRKYKGLDILLRAMPQLLKRLPELRLIVAGEFYDDENEYRSLIQKVGIPPNNLILATDYIPNNEVARYFSAANACVLPYRSATQSGIVLVAYNFDVPAIAADVGGLAEVVMDGTSGLITREATPESLAEKIIEFFEDDLEEELTRGVVAEKQKYSWDAFAEGIERLCSSEGAPRRT